MRLLIFIFLFGLQGLFPDNGTYPKKTICLNLIVQNEGRRIERCLKSIKPLIDYWVILDTGSTDNTIEVIKKALQGIPGELHEGPWIDFTPTRNELLRLSKNKGDYLFLMDPNESIKYLDGFSLPALDQDLYFIRCQNGGKKIFCVNNHLDWRWEGDFYPVLYSSQAHTSALLENVVSTWDRLYLEREFWKNPKNSRFAYVTGVTYSGAKDEEAQTAKVWFQQRLEMKSEDDQETFYALYLLGAVQERFGEISAALDSYSRAFQFRPSRMEPLFKIARIYRYKGDPLSGYLISKFALSLPYPQNDFCKESLIYDCELLNEFANCALLLGKYEEGADACAQLLANPKLPEEFRPLIRQNYEIVKTVLTKNP